MKKSNLSLILYNIIKKAHLREAKFSQEKEEKKSWEKSNDGKFWVRNKKSNNVYTVVEPNTNIHEPISAIEAEKQKLSKSKPKEIQQSQVKGDINSEAVTKAASELVSKQQPQISRDQLQKEEDKKEYLKKVVSSIIESSSVESKKGHGKYILSSEDLITYKNYLEGKNNVHVPNYNIEEKDVDDVLNEFKTYFGKDYGKFIRKLASKGAPPPDLINIVRARGVLKDYLVKGGTSPISGKTIPFFESQLDHRIALTNGGVDCGGNWDWVEARFNQFKKNFTNEQTLTKINDLINNPEKGNEKKLKAELKSLVRQSYSNYFKTNGFDSLTKEDVYYASGEKGVQFLKAIAENAGISYYQGEGGGDTRARGVPIPVSELQDRILKKLKPMSKKDMKHVDDKLEEIKNQIENKEKEIKQLKKKK